MTSPAQTSAPVARPNNMVGVALLALWLASGAALAAGYAPGPLTFAFVVLGWVLSVTAHEFSHAAVAYMAGDRTVVQKGYLSFDPRRYGDLGTSLVVPLIALALGGVGFPGGAVYLRHDLMRSRLWRSAASLAGPGGTLAVLLVLALVLNVWALPGPCYDAVAFLALLQATALILNLLPIPGLDGFNAIRPFLPKGLRPAVRKAEGLALIGLLLVLFMVPGAGRSLFDAASSVVGALGVPRSAWVGGYEAFHFWR